jgi:hypothetical protein
LLAFHIGGQDQEYVQVSIVQDNGDGWFSSGVTLAVGCFQGSYSADFNSWAFSDFASQLSRLYDTVSGAAVFTSYEAQLELRLDCDVRGHIAVRGEAMDFAGTGNKLSFRLEIDQSQVPAIMDTLHQALERYPRRVP